MISSTLITFHINVLYKLNLHGYREIYGSKEESEGSTKRVHGSTCEYEGSTGVSLSPLEVLRVRILMVEVLRLKILIVRIYRVKL